MARSLALESRKQRARWLENAVLEVSAELGLPGVQASWERPETQEKDRQASEVLVLSLENRECRVRVGCDDSDSARNARRDYKADLRSSMSGFFRMELPEASNL